LAGVNPKTISDVLCREKRPCVIKLTPEAVSRVLRMGRADFYCPRLSHEFQKIFSRSFYSICFFSLTRDWTHPSQ
jgi:hypothetical protein